MPVLAKLLIFICSPLAGYYNIQNNKTILKNEQISNNKINVNFTV